MLLNVQTSTLICTFTAQKDIRPIVIIWLRILKYRRVDLYPRQTQVSWPHVVMGHSWNVMAIVLCLQWWCFGPTVECVCILCAQGWDCCVYWKGLLEDRHEWSCQNAVLWLTEAHAGICTKGKSNSLVIACIVGLLSAGGVARWPTHCTVIQGKQLVWVGPLVEAAEGMFSVHLSPNVCSLVCPSSTFMASAYNGMV